MSSSKGTTVLFRILIIASLCLLVLVSVLWIRQFYIDRRVGYVPRIGIVDMDKVETKYQFFVDIRSKISSMANSKDEELYALLKNYESHIALLEEKKDRLTSKEVSDISRGLKEMEKIYRSLSSTASNQLSAMEAKLMRVARKKVRSALKKYNEKLNFEYVLNKREQVVLYLKNTRCDITDDFIKSLNREYKQHPLIQDYK